MSSPSKLSKIYFDIVPSYFEYLVTSWIFCGEELLAPRPIPKLENRPLSAVRHCLFSILIRSYPQYLEAVFLSATWGRAMPWWQTPSYHWILYKPNYSFPRNVTTHEHWLAIFLPLFSPLTVSHWDIDSKGDRLCDSAWRNWSGVTRYSKCVCPSVGVVALSFCVTVVSN